MVLAQRAAPGGIRPISTKTDILAGYPQIFSWIRHLIYSYTTDPDDAHFGNLALIKNYLGVMMNVGMYRRATA